MEIMQQEMIMKIVKNNAGMTLINIISIVSDIKTLTIIKTILNIVNTT